MSTSLAGVNQKREVVMCGHRRLRSACTSAQSDRSFQWAFCGKPSARDQCFFMRNTKTMIRRDYTTAFALLEAGTCYSWKQIRYQQSYLTLLVFFKCLSLYHGSASTRGSTILYHFVEQRRLRRVCACADSLSLRWYHKVGMAVDIVSNKDVDPWLRRHNNNITLIRVFAAPI